MKRILSLFLIATFTFCAAPTFADDAQWVVYPGGDGPGKGKHIVLVSGDEEYRSEEALPQLGKILSTKYGFKCTVLFAIDPKTGEINPDVTNNIPGLEALKSADMMLLFTRMRTLPDDQLKHIDEFIKDGKPIVALRTSTHAFSPPGKSEYARFHWQSKEPGWEKGFGKKILGETWVNHHGGHGSQATRGILAEAQKNHPILKGIKDGDIFGPSDVYTVTTLPGDSVPLVMGQVVKGMKFDDPALDGPKNSPMMPLAWTKTYSISEGKTGRVFTTTIGASQDLSYEGTRRMVVNACFWAVGLEDKIPEKTNVDVVGEYKPTPFKFKGATKGVKPADHAWPK
jgi:hypothetical protein